MKDNQTSIQPTASVGRETLDNCTYFILPLRVNSVQTLDAYLQSDPDWALVPEGFQTQYLLCYASDMNRAEDDRFQRYRYRAPQSLPLCTFRERIGEQLQKRTPPAAPSGAAPVTDAVSLYVFGTGVAFLEFRILYGKMNVWEILEYVNLFRSLRNDESKVWLHMQPGEISLKTAAEQILPAGKSGTQLCFSNPTEIKAQAYIFTILHAGTAEIGTGPEDGPDMCGYLLAHGFRNVDPAVLALSHDCEMQLHMKKDEYWRGSQDGLVCITRAPYLFQSDHLNVDYHFQYLLLLNQRLTSIADIEAMTLPNQTMQTSKQIHQRVVELKTRYAFRVVSDDYFMQTVYGEMYRVLDLDHLLEDLEDGNDQMNSILQVQQEKQTRRFNGLLGVISILTIFSAMVDLADYMKGFEAPYSLISLVFNAAILVAAGVLLFKKSR